jgi:transposase InsO family protein
VDDVIFEFDSSALFQRLKRRVWVFYALIFCSFGGTAIIEKLLRDNGGEMGSGELAEAAKDQGVKYPHSSFQSLKKRGRIKLEDHVVHLIEE